MSMQHEHLFIIRQREVKCPTCNFSCEGSRSKQNIWCLCGAELLLSWSEPPAQEERVWCRARPSGGINTWSRFRFWSNPELFTSGRRGQRWLFNLWDWNVELSSLLFISLTAAVICRIDLHCRVFMFCHDGCWVSAQCWVWWLTWIQTHRHLHPWCLLLQAS